MDEVLQLYETLNMFYILFGGCVLGLLGTNICTVGIMQTFKLQLFVNPRRFLITGNSVLCYLLLICRYLKSIYRNQCQIRSGFNSVGRFSSWFNPSGPMINRLKYFRIRFRFRWDIQTFNKLRGAHHTSESSSAVCIIPQSQAPQCIPLRSQAPQCASHRGVKLHTMESKSKSLEVSGCF